MEMGKSSVCSLVAESRHLPRIAFRAVQVIEVNWVINNNHIKSLKGRRRKREEDCLVHMGTERRHCRHVCRRLTWKECVSLCPIGHTKGALLLHNTYTLVYCWFPVTILG